MGQASGTLGYWALLFSIGAVLAELVSFYRLLESPPVEWVLVEALERPFPRGMRVGQLVAVALVCLAAWFGLLALGLPLPLAILGALVIAGLVFAVNAAWGRGHVVYLLYANGQAAVLDGATPPVSVDRPLGNYLHPVRAFLLGGFATTRALAWLFTVSGVLYVAVVVAASFRGLLGPGSRLASWLPPGIVQIAIGSVLFGLLAWWRRSPYAQTLRELRAVLRCRSWSDCRRHLVKALEVDPDLRDALGAHPDAAEQAWMDAPQTA